MDYKKLVAERIKEHVDLELENIEKLIEIPPKPEMGDFAFPCFQLAKVMRKAPNMIAAELAEKINKEGFERVECLGPYLNFFVDKVAFSKNIISKVLEEGDKYGSSKIGEGKNVVVEYSSPNIAKPFHVGHLFTTAIGHSLYRMLNFEGYNPIRINHLGDWGTQFGKLMAAYEMWGNEEEVKNDPINTLQKYYVKINTEADTHPEYNDLGREWFKKLENGDKEAYRLWKWFRNESLKRFMKIYRLLDIDFDSYNGEAFYNDKMAEIDQLLQDKHLLHESKGAQIVDLEKYNLNPALIKKSDGSSLYITRDLSAALFRKRMYGFAQALYVVGAEQRNHFDQLKAVLSEMGFTWSKQIHYIPFGLMSLNGKKMSTRKGNIVQLEDVLNDSIKLARQQIAEKNPDLANADEVAQQVGVGAVIFHDLKNERTNSIDFKLADVVKFEGETGPYVQYAHARAESILRKAGQPTFNDEMHLTLSGDEAWGILTRLGQYSEVIERAAKEYDPSLIGKYALALAKDFNQYYAHTRILVDDDEKLARLALVKAVSEVLKSALALLEVKAPDEM